MYPWRKYYLRLIVVFTLPLKPSNVAADALIIFIQLFVIHCKSLINHLSYVLNRFFKVPHLQLGIEIDGQRFSIALSDEEVGAE